MDQNLTFSLSPSDNAFDEALGTPSPSDDYPKETPGPEYKIKLYWFNIAMFAYLHAASVYGVYLMFTSASWATIYFAVVLFHCAGLGITAGAHRLWSHRSYKAKLPLRILLTIFNTLAFQNHVIEWSRDHRVHHKYSDTNADPYNARRGFFFSHMGWLMCRKHPDVIHKGKGIGLIDLYNDPVLVFQRKYYKVLMPIACFVLPTTIPVYCWGESWTNAWHVPTLLRFTLTLNVTGLVNSFAHMTGQRPYDRHIHPADHKYINVGVLGEGWHNFHHTFPWDYKSAELGNFHINFTTLFIEFMGKIGWAYEMKTASSDMIKKRALRTGDGSHPQWSTSHETGIWGWGDKKMLADDIHDTILINCKQLAS